MSRLVLFLTLSIGCQPKQPLQPSFFTAKDPNAPATCRQTVACYDACSPLTEECMLLCDRQSYTQAVDAARAVSYCHAQFGCGDAACREERCASQLAACR
jgi:hypothetical protein